MLTNLALLVLEWPEQDQRVGFLKHHIAAYEALDNTASIAAQDKAITHITKAYLGLECSKKFDDMSEDVADLEATLNGHFNDLLHHFEAEAASSPDSRILNLSNDGIRSTYEALNSIHSLTKNSVDDAAQKQKTMAPYVRDLLRDVNNHS